MLKQQNYWTKSRQPQSRSNPVTLIKWLEEHCYSSYRENPVCDVYPIPRILIQGKGIDLQKDEQELENGHIVPDYLVNFFS